MWSQLDMRWLKRAFRRRRALWVLPLLVTPVFAALAWGALPTTWKSQAKVFVQEAKAVNPFLEDMTVDWSAQSRIQVMSNVLKSESTLERVLRQAGELAPDATHEQVVARIRAFRADTDVFSLGGGVVQISVTARAAEESERMLKQLMDTFVAEMLRPQKESVDGSTRFLKGQLERLRGELGELEKETAEFKSRNASELPEVYRVNLDALLQLRKSLMEAEMNLEASKRQRRLAEERLRKLNPVTRELEGRLIEARAHLAELRAVYTDAHLEVVTAAALVTQLERQLRASQGRAAAFDLATLEAIAARTADSDATQPQVGRTPAPGSLLASEVIGFKQLLADIEGQQGRVELLREKIDEASRSVQAFASNEQSLNRLVRDLDIKSRVYRTLLEKYEEALVTRELSLYDEDKQVWIIEPPTRPTRPLKAPLPVVLAGALAGGGVLGIVLVLVAEFLSAGVRRHEVEGLTGVPVVAVLPELRA